MKKESNRWVINRYQQPYNVIYTANFNTITNINSLNSQLTIEIISTFSNTISNINFSNSQLPIEQISTRFTLVKGAMKLFKLPRTYR